MNPIEALMETATPLQRKLLEGCRYVPETGCWARDGKTPYFYHDGKYSNAKHFSFESFVGPLHENDRLTNNCSTPSCVNPTHMEPVEYINWTFESCKEVFEKYESFALLSKERPDAKSAAYKNGWAEELTKHMVMNGGREHHGYWTKERCREEALKYESYGDFRKYSSAAESCARRNGWLPEIGEHLTKLKVPDGYWTKERCREEALKYETHLEMRKKASSAYSTIKREKWDDLICHLTHIHKNVDIGQRSGVKKKR